MIKMKELEITNNLNGKQFGKLSRRFDRDLFYYQHSYKTKWKVLKEGTPKHVINSTLHQFLTSWCCRSDLG